MALLTALVVYVVVFHLHWQSNLNREGWFKWWADQVEAILGESNWQGWGGLTMVLLVPPGVLLILFYSLDGVFGQLIQLALAMLVLYVGIGGETIGRKISPYLSAAEKGDMEGANLSFAELDGNDDAKEPDELIRHVTRFLCVDSLRNSFGVLFWFILFGPAPALLYRLAHWYADTIDEEHPHRDHLQSLIHWLDWLPTRLTALLFLLTGDFVAGFYRLKDYLYDADADNNQLIADIGVAALGLNMGVADHDIEENRQCLALIDRTLILYLVVAALMAPLGLWP